MIVEKTIENLNEIKYGWIDKNGNIYKKSTKDFFMNNYHLMSIDEIKGFGVGTSFEEAEYARYLLENENINCHTYYINYDGIDTANYCIATCYLDGKYWALDSYRKYSGLKISFDTIYELLLSYIEFFPKIYAIKNFDFKNISVCEYEKPSYGISYEAFSNFCKGYEKFNFEKYIENIVTNFYVESQKDLFINEIVEKSGYKILSSNFIKDERYNCVYDISKNENIKNIESEISNEMIYRDAKNCFLTFSDDNNAYLNKNYEMYLEQSLYIFYKFYSLNNIKNEFHEIKISKTVDMELFADKFEDIYLSNAENVDGYRKVFKNYVGTKTKIKHDFLFIEVDLDLEGIAIVSYDKEKFFINSIKYFKGFDDEELKEEIMKRILHRYKNKKFGIFLNEPKNIKCEKVIELKYFIKKI